MVKKKMYQKGQVDEKKKVELPLAGFEPATSDYNSVALPLHFLTVSRF